MHIRELTKRERRAIRTLVKTTCANYDTDDGCLILDSPCYMFCKVYTDGALCKWFRKAIMPQDAKIEQLFVDNGIDSNKKPNIPPNKKPCAICGRMFPVKGRKIYCSEACAADYRRKYIAHNVKEYRKRKQGTVNCDNEE